MSSDFTSSLLFNFLMFYFILLLERGGLDNAGDQFVTESVHDEFIILYIVSSIKLLLQPS